MIKINSYEKAFEMCGTQVTAQGLLNGKMYIKDKGHSDITLTEAFRRTLIERIVSLLGGHDKTKRRVKSVLTYGSFQHWGLDRFHVDKINYIKDEPAKYELNYCAGQDYPEEINNIRKELAK